MIILYEIVFRRMICMSKIIINTLYLSSNLIEKITSFMYYTPGVEIDMLIDGNNISFDESSLTPVQKNEFFQWLSCNNIEYKSTPTPQEPKLSYVLPITKFTDVSLFQNHVLLMQIPFINNLTYPWFCCSFINIYTSTLKQPRYRKAPQKELFQSQKKNLTILSIMKTFMFMALGKMVSMFTTTNTQATIYITQKASIN